MSIVVHRLFHIVTGIHAKTKSLSQVSLGWFLAWKFLLNFLFSTKLSFYIFRHGIAWSEERELTEKTDLNKEKKGRKRSASEKKKVKNSLFFHGWPSATAVLLLIFNWLRKSFSVEAAVYLRSRKAIRKKEHVPHVCLMAIIVNVVALLVNRTAIEHLIVALDTEEKKWLMK